MYNIYIISLMVNEILRYVIRYVMNAIFVLLSQYNVREEKCGLCGVEWSEGRY